MAATEQRRDYWELATENSKEASDEDLMQAVAKGDFDAFGEIVLRYQKLAWRIAHRLLGNSMEAEDAAQETFLKILEAAPRYRPTATFRTYFYRILTHLCIDRTRKKHPASMVSITEMPDPSASPTDDLIAKELSARIRTALDALPPNQKAAMIMRHYEGLSYADIAQTLGVTPKAVERLIARAGASLQTHLSLL
jgi:RNA polymerase sigma-70 factor, ECF subfamily